MRVRCAIIILSPTSIQSSASLQSRPDLSFDTVMSLEDTEWMEALASLHTPVIVFSGDITLTFYIRLRASSLLYLAQWLTYAFCWLGFYWFLFLAITISLETLYPAWCVVLTQPVIKIASVLIDFWTRSAVWFNWFFDLQNIQMSLQSHKLRSKLLEFARSCVGTDHNFLKPEDFYNNRCLLTGTFQQTLCADEA